MPAPERVVSSGETRLAVRDHGGRGRPIVLLHGLSSNLHIWDAVAPLLTDRFRVVAYDQRGHGRSDDGDDYSFPSLVRDLETVVSALGLERPLTCGHSWGASVALHYAAANEDCPGVIGVDGGVIDMQGMGMSWEDTYSMLLPPDVEGPPDELLPRIRAEQPLLPWDLLERVVRRGFPVGQDGVMRRRLPIPEHMRIVRELWEERLEAVYDRVRCPVMLVLASGVGAGERERGFVEVKREGARRLVERHPGVRVEWLPSVHDVPLLHPRELVALVTELLPY